MVYPPQEVCSAGTEAIQQFLCKGKAQQPASFAQRPLRLTLHQPGRGWGWGAAQPRRPVVKLDPTLYLERLLHGAVLGRQKAEGIEQ